MPVWEFEIKQSGKEKVQGVGMRPFIISFMLERGFERGDVSNSADGKRVIVLLECENKKTAQDFGKALALEIRSEAKSEYSSLPSTFSMLQPKKQNSHNPCLSELRNKAPAMVLSQTSKGVGVMVAMHREMRKGFGTDMRKGFSGMQKGFDGMRKEIGGMRSEIRKGFGTDMRKGFDGLRSEIGGLRSEIGGVRSEIRKGFGVEMRNGFDCLQKSVDKLPDRIAKALVKALHQANKTSQNS